MRGFYEARVLHGSKGYVFAIPSASWTGSIAQLIDKNHPLNELPFEELCRQRVFSGACPTIIVYRSTAEVPPIKSVIQPEKFDMSAPVIQEITQYRGRDIKGLSNDTILDAIRSDKKEIKGLQDVGVESTHITAKIETLNAGITRLVEELDSRD